MTLQRDLAWQNLELLYRSSVTYQFARYALGLDYKQLPAEVVHYAKRCVLDALGCAMGAYDAPGRPMVEEMVKDLGGVKESTVWGSGMRTTATNATLVNSFLVRFLDCNDLGGGGHNSDAIASIIAVAEREKSNGQDFLTAVVISYELGARFFDAVGSDRAMEVVGWMTDIRAGLNMPPALGKLMGLNEDQIANAIGACASRSLPMLLLDTDKEENTMSKNLRFGYVCHDAILACLLAKRGFTGPIRVVEGENGIKQTIMRGNMDLERLVDFSGWRIMDTRHKLICTCGGIIGCVVACIELVTKNDIKPEDISHVTINISPHNVRHMTTAAKKYPRNAESADHSAYYACAAAIKERKFGPESFEPEKFTDPVILDLIEKMWVGSDPTMPEHGYQGSAEIILNDGRSFKKRADVPHGVDDDPLTDAEIEDKARSMSDGYLPKLQVQKIFDTVWNLEKLGNMNDLAKLMVFPSK